MNVENSSASNGVGSAGSDDLSLNDIYRDWISSGKKMSGMKLPKNFIDIIFCDQGGIFAWYTKDNVNQDVEVMELKFCRNYPGKKPAYWDGWTWEAPPLKYENIEWVPNKTGLELPSFVWNGKRWRLLKSTLNIEFYRHMAALLVYDD